jgi:hypothetical protein
MQPTRDLLEDLYRDVDVREGKWQATILKYATAYETAFKGHVGNLPTAFPLREPFDLFVLDFAAAKGLAQWLKPDGIKLALKPVKEVLSILNNAILKGEAERIKSNLEKVHVPVVRMTPGEYHRGLLANVTILCTTYKQEIQNLIKAEGLLGRISDATGTKEAFAQSYYKLQKSGFWLPPSDWHVRDEKLIAVEFEKAYWAKWAVKRLSGKTWVDLYGIDFTPTVKRLRELRLTDQALLRQYTTDAVKVVAGKGIGGPAMAAHLAFWGLRYAPKQKIGLWIPPPR